MNYLDALCKQILDVRERGAIESEQYGRRCRSTTSAALALARHRGGRSRVSLLAVDAPIAQFLERDGLSCDSAAHERAGADDSKVAVKILDFRFARVGRAPLDPVHGEDSLFLPRYGTAGPSRSRCSCYNTLDKARLLW